MITVPRSAVLETATGKFAFVENGDYLLRTSIVTGAETAEYGNHRRDLRGRYRRDQTCRNLYLIELRATKGGGHSH